MEHDDTEKIFEHSHSYNIIILSQENRVSHLIDDAFPLDTRRVIEHYTL